ncbi:DDE-type integrase/transposase/recombinase [Pseudomonas sp. B21-040]|uniref:DDE-type integrase/transposase/recombinase n=1 Tax=Pseudomonas sp. B21-040 TaxID=2895486 RepID=UPI00215F2AC2|nr:DDE-type integrase/transposase/recombinase [Pseudomonas sp. B21-040]UVL42185.1 DDE-type integrase/transposase/recombinase [Pseudomonas sp. B21-040]
MSEQPEAPTVGSQYIVHGRTMEVIHVDEELVTLRDLERTYTRALAVDAMMSELSHHTIVPFARPPGAGSKALAFLFPDDPQVIAAQRKYRYVDAAFKQFGGPLPVEATKALIDRLSAEMSDSSPPSYNSLYKWLKYYREHNFDRFCLLKDKSVAPRGKRLAADVEAITREIIDQEYKQTTPPTRPITIHRLIDGQITLMNRLRAGYSTLLLKAPSLSTIQRRLKKLCQFTSDTKRYGSDYAKKKHHSSKLSMDPDEVLDLAEIDSHLVDIVIIDNQGKSLGKILWWTVILEIKTRMIIGWELSTTYPCAEKTIRALKNALRAVPGEEYLRGKPIRLRSDNGSEFVNAIIRYFLDRLNITYDRPPPYTPNARPDIERLFRTFELWLHEQAGSTMSTPAECQYYNSESEAAFTEESMNRHVEDWVEKIYHQRKHSALNMPPAIAWERAMKNGLPPEKFSEEDLDKLCRVIQPGMISAAGRINFLCLSWYGPDLQEIRSRLKKGQPAICYYNPLDLGEIWVAHPNDTRNPVRASGTNPQYQNGLTLTEHKLLHQQYLDAGRKFDNSEANVALWRLRQRMVQEYEASRHLRTTKPNNKTKLDPFFDNETNTAISEDKPIVDGEIPTFMVDQL